VFDKDFLSKGFEIISSVDLVARHRDRFALTKHHWNLTTIVTINLARHEK